MIDSKRERVKKGRPPGRRPPAADEAPGGLAEAVRRLAGWAEEPVRSWLAALASDEAAPAARRLSRPGDRGRRQPTTTPDR
jgi:hypothetical protein